MVKYLVASPPSHRHREEGVVLVNLDDHPWNGRLNLEPGIDFSWESLANQRVADCPDPGTEEGREEANNRINDEVGADLVELLNFIQSATGAEVSAEGSFEVVECDDCPLCGEPILPTDETEEGSYGTVHAHCQDFEE